jgi:hypothetical protein
MSFDEQVWEERWAGTTANHVRLGTQVLAPTIS